MRFFSINFIILYLYKNYSDSEFKRKIQLHIFECSSCNVVIYILYVSIYIQYTCCSEYK